jgi:competence protein ComEA
MKGKKELTDYFTFSRKDRIAAIAFLLVMAVLALLPHFLPSRSSGLRPLPDSLLSRRDTSADDNAPQADAYAFGPERPKEPEANWRRATPFPFDPNTLDAAGWGRLGLPDRTIRTILKYRDKGGRFRRAEDLARIWGLPPGFYEHVRDQVRIAGANSPKASGSPFTDRPSFARKERLVAPVSINESDSTAWEALPGIGAKLASRILRFRERLGGFYRVEQVGETWGLPDSTFQQIRPFLIFSSGSRSIRKFNLNTATKEELKVHPYLRWNLANALVEYRNRHGNFQTVDELRKVLIISDSVFERIAPYFEIK